MHQAPNIRERLLYYVWKTKNFDHQSLQTVDGKEIEIHQYGIHNMDSGPDFSNARLTIDGVLWVGHVEMHTRSSDWNSHQHQADPAYKSVILHVVFDHDEEVFDCTGRQLPCLELKSRIPSHILQNYHFLLQAQSQIACQNLLTPASFSTFQIWKYTLVSQRLIRKCAELRAQLIKSQQDWETLLYHQVCKYLGGKVNRENFLTLAQRCDRSIIQKNADDPIKIEALLFGMAGFLDEDHRDLPYAQSLKQTFDFMKKKYQLKSMDRFSWKFSRMMPAGFPTVRIALLSALLLKHPQLFGHIRELKRYEEVYECFKVEAPEFWKHHYHFRKQSPRAIQGISQELSHILLINAVIPVLFLFAKSTDDLQLQEKCIDWLDQIPAENNQIIRKMRSIGFEAKSAADSQALIELDTQFCAQKYCASCAIGAQLIGRKHDS